jgi:two-component system, OmpR family, response regulator CpxR
MCAFRPLPRSGKHTEKAQAAIGRRQTCRSSLLSASWFRPERGPVFALTCKRGRSRIFFGTRMRPTETLCGRTRLKCVCMLTASRAVRGTKGKEELRPKKTILCVDDNEQVLAVRKFMLETRGYRVVTAQGAADALEMFRSGGIDLVLSDLIMPQMDGNEMVRRMKDITSDVPMILVSGTVKDFDRASHADAFLPKGASTPVEVLERIRVMIARKRGPKKAMLRPVFAPGVQPAIAS